MSMVIKSGARAEAVGVDLALAGTGVKVVSVSGRLSKLVKSADVCSVVATVWTKT
jgi:hypothetical protein